MALRALDQIDFSGGVNAVTSPYQVTNKQIFRVRNLLLDEHASLVTRPGYSVVGTGTDTTNPIVHVGVLNTVSGSVLPFAVQNNGTRNTVYRTDTATWTTVGTTGSAFLTPDSVTVNDAQVFAMGYETPWRWDGTTFTQITATAGQTVPLGARHLAFHLGSLWAWNTNGTTTTLDGPSSLRMSDANNVNSWPNANQTFVARDDGQVGMGVGVYTIAETGISPTTTLIAFKNYSGYQVTGVFGSSIFSVQKLKSDMGCVAPRTIQFISGFGIIRLTHKGFGLFNGVDDRLISEEIRPYIFGRDELTALNFGSIDRSWAAQGSNPPLYICACPTTSTTLDRIFVYDLVRRAWTVCDLPIGLASLILFTSPSSAVQPEVRAGRTTGGQIVRAFNPLDASDAGSGIAWSVQTGARFLGSPLRPTYWRRILADLLFTSPQSVTFSTSLGGISAAVATTVSYTGTGITYTYGSGIYGSATYGTQPATVSARTGGPLMRTAPTAQTTISGTGNVRIRGIAFHVEPKPVKRLTTVGAI